MSGSFNLSPLSNLIGALGRIIGAIVPILVTAALVVFFYGLVRYLWGGGSEPDIENAKKLIQWGLITLFVMSSVWGIVYLAQTALNLNTNAQVSPPKIQYSGT